MNIWRKRFSIGVWIERGGRGDVFFNNLCIIFSVDYYLFLQKSEFLIMTKKKKVLNLKVVDLFCGVGGLTHGFIQENFEVVAGYDTDKTCKFAYEENNGNTKFISKDISKVDGDEILKLYNKKDLKILVGCAPCQPFSTYSYKSSDKKKWGLLAEFARLISQVKPDIVSMENVPRLLNFNKAPVFKKFLKLLEEEGYEYFFKIVNCPNYGIPQHRKRLVLLASKFGKIELIPETHSKDNYVTVKDVIKKMAPLKSGESSKTDPIHRASKLSEKNLKRIKQSKPGGSWKDWDKDLWLECHKKDSGKTYVSVYGRMQWEEPAPTMTTHCTGIGNGRFGHPEQNRAISLREAALLQTFPKGYKFAEKDKPINVTNISTHIGNAVPVKLGRVIAKSIKKHLEENGILFQ